MMPRFFHMTCTVRHVNARWIVQFTHCITWVVCCHIHGAPARNWWFDRWSRAPIISQIPCIPPSECVCRCRRRRRNSDTIQMKNRKSVKMENLFKTLFTLPSWNRIILYKLCPTFPALCKTMSETLFECATKERVEQCTPLNGLLFLVSPICYSQTVALMNSDLLNKKVRWNWHNARNFIAKQWKRIAHINLLSTNWQRLVPHCVHVLHLIGWFAC